ncbi:MAG TPA: DUF493 family protein [bacterium]|nr:DUF493 family protein [bacterium]
MADETVSIEPSGVEGIEYPVEFELRVIYARDAGATLQVDLDALLTERGVALESVRSLPATGEKYGRLACKVVFQDKESLYATYQAIGQLPGVKAVL